MAETDHPDTPRRRPGVTGVHSLNRFVFSVPAVDEAERFFTAFGLDVHRDRDRLDLYSHGHPHCWGSVHANGAPKKLQYLSFGIFPDDFATFRARIDRLGIGCEPHALDTASGDSLWLRTPDGLAVQLVVAPKVTPATKSEPLPPAAVAPGQGAAPGRSSAVPTRPRRLSHLLLFTPDVLRMVGFCTEVLGLRLTDHSGDGIAFLHGVHGSDHHLMAFAKSTAPGLHHSSWDVGSIDQVGWGAERMREQGYTQGWGVGRHVLGSNYFYYVRDPWGSYAEYSYDIDFVPVDVDWPAADHAPEDSFYLWGPPVPDEFVINYEAPEPAGSQPDG